MEAKVTYVSPRLLYIEMLARQLREADVNELKAVHGGDVFIEDVLIRAARMSEDCSVGISHRTGLPVLVRGVAPAPWDPSVAAIWMVGTDEMHGYARNLLVEGKEYVQHWLKTYNMLFNYVDARNTASIRWLLRLGFTFGDPERYGVEGREFFRFGMRADGVHAESAPP